MLRDIFAKLVGLRKKRTVDKTVLDDLAKDAAAAMDGGDPRVAVELFEKYVQLVPDDAGALNNLGVCYAEIGRLEESYKIFDLAYRIDDSNLPVAVNYARHFIDNGYPGKGIPYLKRARVTIPRYPYTNAIYASAALRLGNPDKARIFHLRAWLAQFDTLRLANSYLFSTAYADIDERELAAEHRFWADTCLPSPTPLSAEVAAPKSRQKIRVGYWSPDFHGHSVRYFFRPLLEGHDRDAVEIYLYHDSHRRDIHTEKIEAAADEFFKTIALRDDELAHLIKSHDLDVLVELAGHTSHNRLPVLMNRLARVQLTGLGYPPTTGLASLDGKFLDPYLMVENSAKYYSEPPLVLPHSFWCFDPMEDVPQAAQPPVMKNGFVRFACVGNSAKINDRMLSLWSEILRKVPNSILQLRSINFLDDDSRQLMVSKMVSAGIPKESFEILDPAAGEAFLTSYDAVDIVLDTFPFNGGTTTCTAVYMGVPVISLYGDSLISRMGLSVLSNVDAGDLAAKTADEYVTKAVALANDIERLQDFRSFARARMKAGSLGNGALFARDVESAYRSLLDDAAGEKSRPASQIDLLSPDELTRRAYVALSYAQWPAAERIVRYCLQHYPNFVPAHLLNTEKWVSQGDYQLAVEYLRPFYEDSDDEGKVAILLNSARFLILCGDRAQAAEALNKLEGLPMADGRDILLVSLMNAYLFTDRQGSNKLIQPPAPSPKHYLVLIPCNDSAEYDDLVKVFSSTVLLPPAFKITFERCQEDRRISSYEAALSSSSHDALLVLQKDIEIHNPNLLLEIADALESYDIVGFAGANRWVRIDWNADDFGSRASGFMEQSFEKPGMLDLKIAGPGQAKIVGDMSVLNGGFLAINASRIQCSEFDEELLGAGALLEEYWTYTAKMAGARLAVHRGLGVQLMPDVPVDLKYLTAARVHLAEKMAFDVFSDASDDLFHASVPVETPARGVSLLQQLFTT